MYQGKNYTTDGGDTLHIGGKIEFGEGAGFDGFPAAANVANSGTAAQKIEATLVALKDAGLMVGDAWDVSVPTGITYANMATAETAANSNKVTVTLEDDVFTVAVGGKVEDELSKADHGTTWGKHYWLGFGIRTGLATDAGIKFTQLSGLENGKEPTVVTLTADDDTEANTVGLASAGDIILYIKAEVVRDNGGLTFSLAGLGMANTVYTVVIDETEGE